VTFPALFTVGLHTYSAGADDGYGNPTPVFTPAKEDPGTAYKVFWFAVKASTTPYLMESTGNEDQVFSDAQLCAPRDFPATPYALIDIGDTQYQVLGAADDFNSGPWWVPGMVIWNLRSYAG
jgi:hypothetical protein